MISTRVNSNENIERASIGILKEHKHIPFT
jgi:hypothetical protein